MVTAWLIGVALVGTCWAGSRSLRDELKQMPAKSGLSVAIFDHGKLNTRPMGSSIEGLGDVEISGAVGHSWSDEGMLSPDGTLAAFPYWEVNPCPSWKTCDVEASRHFFLAIVPVNGSGVRKYPQIVLPSKMCWTRDNSKLAMVAQSDRNPQQQLVVLHLDTGRVDRVADGKTVAVTPQCWSPDGKQLVYFAGEKDPNGPERFVFWIPQRRCLATFFTAAQTVTEISSARAPTRHGPRMVSGSRTSR